MPIKSATWNRWRGCIGKITSNSFEGSKWRRDLHVMLGLRTSQDAVSTLFPQWFVSYPIGITYMNASFSTWKNPAQMHWRNPQVLPSQRYPTRTPAWPLDAPCNIPRPHPPLPGRLGALGGSLVGWLPGIIKIPIFGGNQTMQMYGIFEGFHLN